MRHYVNSISCKFEASFNQNIWKEIKNSICNKVDIKTVSSHTRCMGLPVVFGRSKKKVFVFVIDRI